VDWTHLTTSEPLLGVWLCDAPRPLMESFNAAAFDLACEMYPEFGSMHSGVYCRWTGLTMEDSLRDLRWAWQALRCAALCCAVLCCAALCCAVLCGGLMAGGAALGLRGRGWGPGWAGWAGWG
jgi:hypothetical protein